MENKQITELQVLRHSTAHLLAQAILRLMPDTLLTIGPATQDGFFYDILPTKNLKEEDLESLEQEMQKIVQEAHALGHKEIDKKIAQEIFKSNPFKLELIEGIPGETVGLSTQGEFTDLCKGGHVLNTSEIKHFKLLGISGSYWKAERDNQQLQRIHGTAFFSKEDLDNFLKAREELAQRDHRKIGKQLDMFSFHEEGPGFPFYHPKGKAVLNELIKYIRLLRDEDDYQEIQTPTILSDELWKQSGHYEFYKQNMYFTFVDDRSFAIKPMNCPGSILIYKTRPRSYRNLPLKLSEFGHVHRHELSGALHGLMRVRAFTQDDAHIYCMQSQIEAEVTSILNMAFKVLGRFDFADITLRLATKPEKFMGSPESWEIAEQSLTKALDNYGHPYTIAEKDGAFYGPKIEIHIKDSMGRSWQCGTAQVDFALPENFNLNYISSDGSQKRPVIIHVAIYGSLERFFGMLLEHTKGHLPFWLAPEQIRILPISDAQMEYAKIVYDKIKKLKIRVKLETDSDPISAKIKSAQIEKIPLMIIVGKNELESNTVTLRFNDGKQMMGICFEDLVNQINLLNS